MKAALLFLALTEVISAQNYAAKQTTEQDVPIVRLTDAARDVEVSIIPSAGNRAYEMKVKGKNILFTQASDLAQYIKRPPMDGIPFLAPWANRLNEPAFWANGKKYQFNPTLGNVSKSLSIHGLLQASNLWKVTDVAADAQSAHVTSRLEFWRNPDLMEQWPFAHEYEMTYRLSNGVLEVRTTIVNLSTAPMPVLIGFHTFYRIPDIPRDEWTAHIPAKQAVVLDDKLLATGEFKPMDLPDPLTLKGRTLDNGFYDLVRDAEGRAVFSVEAGGKKVEAMFGKNFPAAVVYAPNREFICFEPMAGITNAVNLNHDGKYADLQTIPPGGVWTESFWIRATGF